MMGNVCIKIFLVTLPIAVNSYVVYILTLLSYVHMKKLVYMAFEGQICYWHIYSNSRGVCQ